MDLTRIIYVTAILLLAKIAVTDAKNRNIYNHDILILLLFSLIVNVFNVKTILMSHIAMLPMYITSFWFYEKGRIGAGDVKLLFALTSIVGIKSYDCLVVTLLLTTMYQWFMKLLKKNQDVPMAPFFFIGYTPYLILLL